MEAVAKVAQNWHRICSSMIRKCMWPDYKDDKQCAISYTYDDGLEEHYTLVFPEMEKVGFKGLFWIWGKGIENVTEQQDKPRMTWTQMKEMFDKGHEISSHGWSHADLRNLSLEEVKAEVGRNDSIIQAEIGERSLTFCYPFNSYNEDVRRIVSENRIGTRIKQYAIGGEKSKSTVESLDKWVKELMISNDWE